MVIMQLRTTERINQKTFQRRDKARITMDHATKDTNKANIARWIIMYYNLRMDTSMFVLFAFVVAYISVFKSKINF